MTTFQVEASRQKIRRPDSVSLPLTIFEHLYGAIAVRLQPALGAGENMLGQYAAGLMFQMIWSHANADLGKIAL